MAKVIEETTLENPEAEVILGESTSSETRRIMVYDTENFVIDVPAGAKITFGYFNPASAGNFVGNRYGNEPNMMKQTALRVYERGEKGNQLACFIGVQGFRDLAITKTKLAEKIVVERRYVNEGDGNETWDGKRQKELAAVEESVPF